MIDRSIGRAITVRKLGRTVFIVSFLSLRDDDNSPSYSFSQQDTAMYAASEWLEGHDEFALSEAKARERMDSDKPWETE